MTARTHSLLAAALALGMAACGGDQAVGPPAPVVTAIQVTPGTDTLLTLGRTRQFAAQARDANGNAVSGVTFVWRSSNPAVATVDSVTGVVTAVGNGLSVIRAVAGGVAGQATLAVAQVVASVLVTPGTASLTSVGLSQPFSAVAKDSGGATVAGVKFLWLSSDHTVATVDTIGVARSKGPGQAIITAAGRGVPGSAVLTVTQAAVHLAFVAVPGAVVAGDAFPSAVQVEVRDSAGAVVAGSHTPVTIKVDSSAVGQLTGTVTVAPSGGVATFIGVSFEGTAGAHRLRATASGLDSALSALVAVAPGVASQIFYTGGGADDAVGQPQTGWHFTLADRFGNLATTTTDSVHLLVATSTWGSHLRGPTGVVPVGAVATFSGFTLDRPGDVTLAAEVHGDTSAPSFLQFRDTLPSLTTVSIGDTHLCAVGVTGTFCWGRNDHGELGNGTVLADSVPVLVQSPLTFTSLLSGHNYTCGIATGGAAYCWGIDLQSGQTDSLPVPVPGGLQFTKLVGGTIHICGLTVAGAVYCWGNNFYGQLGDARASGISTATPVLAAGGHTFTDVTASNLSTCAVATGGAAYCWGYGAYGSLGTGSTGNDSVPTPVKGAHQFTRISLGAAHTCGLAVDSLAYCWGNNNLGMLGDSTTAPDSIPVAVHGGHKFTSIAAGGQYTCGLVAGGVWCWGANGISISGVPIDMGFSAGALFAGQSDGCILNAGALQCWGTNADFEIGDGTRNYASGPQPPALHAPPPPRP